MLGTSANRADRVREHVTGGSPRHVVQDHRHVDRFRYRPIVEIETVLGRLVVVGSDEEATVHPGVLGVLG